MMKGYQWIYSIVSPAIATRRHHQTHFIEIWALSWRIKGNMSEYFTKLVENLDLRESIALNTNQVIIVIHHNCAWHGTGESTCYVKRFLQARGGYFNSVLHLTKCVKWTHYQHIMNNTWLPFDTSIMLMKLFKINKVWSRMCERSRRFDIRHGIQM